MSQTLLKTAKQILDQEARTISAMRRRVGKEFERAIQVLNKCQGRIIVTGMGKPGFIARKIAATLASTGSPSFFLHPAEAIHGDLGMVTAKDVILAISHSGETEEVVRLLSTIKKIGVFLVAMTSNRRSTLARFADIVLDLGVTKEACPLNLAPSASTTAALAMGDALALCLHKKKGFRSEDFAVLHPGGSLGRQLLRVRDIMRKGTAFATVKQNTSVRSALLAITRARAGSCTVVDRRKQVVGIFTDGDLRRHLRNDGEDVLKDPVEKVATLNPVTIDQDRLAAEALNIMKMKSIDEIPVVDEKKRAIGLLDVQDLLRVGFV
ncbi:MAG: KpsF/GutQ family sugar-phosphate isomerase [Candidatus Omnitrophica bacterium]|nr:KpsF/GutQ family sugar-phosphate isomerase [Candidatus Omnitrophota bacterium]